MLILMLDGVNAAAERSNEERMEVLIINFIVVVLSRFIVECRYTYTSFIMSSN